MKSITQRLRITHKLRKLDKRLEQDMARAWKDTMQAWAQEAQDNVKAVRAMDKALQRAMKGV